MPNLIRKRASELAKLYDLNLQTLIDHTLYRQDRRHESAEVAVEQAAKELAKSRDEMDQLRERIGG